MLDPLYPTLLVWHTSPANGGCSTMLSEQQGAPYQHDSEMSTKRALLGHTGLDRRDTSPASTLWMLGYAA
eukprot:1144704-Pelagomonas_calceolata.AAC.2